MSDLRFNIVDVFAEHKYEGNQLAVFRNPSSLSDDDMQRIAKEMNYAETTFIMSEVERDGGFDVRIFTPEEEIPFAGHPTLGTALIIQEDIVKQNVDQILLNLKVGQIPVTFKYRENQADILWMKQKEPVFGPTADPQELAAVLSIDKEEIDSRFPVQEVSTGLPFVIVPLTGRSAVKRAFIARDKYMDFIRTREAKAILLFCAEPYSEEHDLNARMFADYFGVPEDPATGSANGCLAGYLVEHRYFDRENIDIQVEQGNEIGRPSVLYLRADKDGSFIHVHVGGRVKRVAEGRFI
jgi:trans-2,3-dihydro-3-hydroxyanthranilate isomerase